MDKLKCFERPHKTKNAFSWKNTVVLFPRDACPAVISAWVYCGDLIWMTLNGTVKCCLFSVHSIRNAQSIHTFLLTTVCAGMWQLTTMTISQSLRDPSAPQAVRKVHFASLYFSFSGLYLFFWFVIESLSHFYPFKKMGCSLSVEYALISSCMHVEKPSLPNLQQLAVCLWNCLWLWNAPLCPHSEHVAVFVIVAGKVLLAS